MTLLIKGLGLALSVASGLSLGKEVQRNNLDCLKGPALNFVLGTFGACQLLLSLHVDRLLEEVATQ